ncbi:hypothetical protein ml_362 [Mollivirus sibericum]|uniref:hypothetical protein n=1 Tax=Mollivirus sibericum TaxID=1678078 RepID=UPI0006B2DF85|nr:hypothetical protein ml_362 [Mollivirus sibericum]ALD62164.1 hypothetical protein ml_362 [Mollivirus sibericum]
MSHVEVKKEEETKEEQHQEAEELQEQEEAETTNEREEEMEEEAKEGEEGNTTEHKKKEAKRSQWDEQMEARTVKLIQDKRLFIVGYNNNQRRAVLVCMTFPLLTDEEQSWVVDYMKKTKRKDLEDHEVELLQLDRKHFYTPKQGKLVKDPPTTGKRFEGLCKNLVNKSFKKIAKPRKRDAEEAKENYDCTLSRERIANAARVAKTSFWCSNPKLAQKYGVSADQ